MTQKKWAITFSLLLALLFSLTACSDDETTMDNKEVDETFEAQIEPVGERIYSYSVENLSEDDRTYEFSSGQRFDYTISKNNEVIYQLSSVSSYIQTMGSETIKPSETLSYDFELPVDLLQDGIYTIEAWLTTKDGEKHKTSIQYNSLEK